MNYLWIYLSILACILTGCKVIFLNFISMEKVNSYLIFSLVNIVIGLFSLIYVFYDFNNINKICNNYHYILIFLTAFIIFSATYLIVYILQITPNVSYVHSILNLSIILTIIASYYIFNQSLNYKTLFGMLLSLVGVIIMIYYSNN
jgi:drug/metabolite transporter (DMT)-like permease